MGNDKQALAATANATNLSTSPPTLRRKTLGAILAKTYACARRPLPDAVVLDFEAQCFDEALTAAGVPTEDLDEVYQRAIATHTSAFPLGTGELITAWGELQDARRAAARAAEHQAYMARLQEREAEMREHARRLETDPAYRAEHEARRAHIDAIRQSLRDRLQVRAPAAPAPLGETADAHPC